MKKVLPKRNQKRDQAEIQEMIRLYREGLSMREVGEKFNISRQRIERIFKKAGVETRKQTKSQTFLESLKKRRKKIVPKELILKYYKLEKMPVRDILKKLNITLPSFYKNLVYHDIERRISEGIVYSRLTKSVLCRLYLEEKLTAKQIADKLGYSPVTVKNRLSKYGIRKGAG